MVFSQLFRDNLREAVWFAVAVNSAALVNLFWVYITPALNRADNNIEMSNSYNRSYFTGFPFWFPIILMFSFLGIYFYRIPFDCTALYALFVDQDLTLVVREVIGKLMGRTYAPHLLNVLTSAVAPIVAFMVIGRIWFSLSDKKYLQVIILLLLLLSAVLIMPLIGGAKGSLVPMFVALSVIGFLVVKKWRWKIVIVPLIAVIFAGMILIVKVMQESNVGKGGYEFGKCMARLDVCDRAKNLLESLKPPKSYYGMSRQRIDELGYDMANFCKDDKVVYEASSQSLSDDGKESANPSEVSVSGHIWGLVYRIIATPLQVVSWHYIYVEDYGRPGLLGISIAKLFSPNYISVPAKVCEIYYKGDKTSACTAPTSYLFTYPAYMGYLGLLLACVLTIIFDIFFSLLIKYTNRPFADLATGVVVISIVNFIVADFTTVIISHGTAIAFVMILIMYGYMKFFSKADK
ncbi:MAG: hypothetical protein R3D71_03075 [Rickettsiales bacterium]